MPWTPPCFNVKLFRFADGVNKQTYGVLFWAVTVVNSPREMKNVRLAVGSNSASMWWLNGQEAVDLFGDRRMVMDDCVSKRLTLNKGRNVIRGAVINGPGLSDFCVRFIDENGQPIKDLTLSLENAGTENPKRSFPEVSMKSRILAAAVPALLSLWLSSPALALDGEPYIHDPSTVLLCDGKYYAWGTGGSGLVSDDGWTWHSGATGSGRGGPRLDPHWRSLLHGLCLVRWRSGGRARQHDSCEVEQDARPQFPRLRLE